MVQYKDIKAGQKYMVRCNGRTGTRVVTVLRQSPTEINQLKRFGYFYVKCTNPAFAGNDSLLPRTCNCPNKCLLGIREVLYSVSHVNTLGNFPKKEVKEV